MDFTCVAIYDMLFKLLIIVSRLRTKSIFSANFNNGDDAKIMKNGCTIG